VFARSKNFLVATSSEVCYLRRVIERPEFLEDCFVVELIGGDELLLRPVTVHFLQSTGDDDTLYAFGLGVWRKCHFTTSFSSKIGNGQKPAENGRY
jgi:hypothetical protein